MRGACGSSGCFWSRGDLLRDLVGLTWGVGIPQGLRAAPCSPSLPQPCRVSRGLCRHLAVPCPSVPPRRWSWVCLFGVSQPEAYRGVWTWEKKNAKKRERSASIKRSVQTDLSQDVRRQENPARLQVICPSQPMRQQEETASQPRQCPARCLCTPQIWEGGREDTRPPCSGTGPLPTGGVSLEVSQDGCPARLPQGHQPACPAARAEERRGGAGIW